jgi:hypothetical protein
VKTLILSRMGLYRGEDVKPPDAGPYAVLSPTMFLLNNPGAVLIYNSGDDTIFTAPQGGRQHAILLNHGVYDGSYKAFFGEKPALTVDFIGKISIEGNQVHIRGKQSGNYRGTSRLAFWDHPPYLDQRSYLGEGECPWFGDEP